MSETNVSREWLVPNDLRDWTVDIFDTLYRQSFDGVGVSRATYGDGETKAMEVIADRAGQEGLDVSYDAAANLIISLPGEAPDRPFVACGSHLDSVPEGGNFDGAAGVIAGLTSLVQLRRKGVTPPRTIKVMGLRGEESAWFGHCYLGSRALFGGLEPEDMTLPHRTTGDPLIDYMRTAGADVQQLQSGNALLKPQDIACYFELHIEQGPVMVARGIPVGIVTGIRGNNRHPNASCTGEAAHSGAVPRWLRHDTVFAASELITRLDRHWQALLEQGEDLVVTVGILGTNPDEHAMSRVPGHINFSLEYRSQSKDLLREFEELVHDEARIIQRLRKVSFDLGAPVETEPAMMDERLVRHLSGICQKLDIDHEQLPSGAGHDAAIFANEGVPSVMIFVRNENGSHNPDEAMDYDDFFLGTEVLLNGMLTAPEALT